MRRAGLLAAGLLLPWTFAKVLHTDSRWILDENNQRYKLRCVNWGGHLEANVPEGLQHQSVDYIANWVANAGFNCVRLTYSIDMALNQSVKVSDSFTQGGTDSGAGVDPLNALYQQAVGKNPWLADATRIDAFAKVIDALGDHNVDVILDNHVSKAQWCCDPFDGNGWWDQAAGYSDTNSRYFKTQNWLDGLTAMAKFATNHSNVIGMSLRNELRALPPQDLSNHADWYKYVGQGAAAVHSTAPDLLVVIGGTDSANDFSFQRTTGPLDTSSFAGKAVWEFHIYSYSIGFITGQCDVFKAQMGGAAGYLLEQGQSYTGPLFLSEFGATQTGANGDIPGGDGPYFSCLVGYMQDNDADWAIWTLAGDYYVRQGTVSSNESYGLLDPTWTDWQNPTLKDKMGSMFDTTQGPGVGTNTLNARGCD